MNKKLPVKSIILGLVLLLAVVLHQLKVIDFYQLIRLGELYAHTWYFPLIIITLKTLFYTFALPGSVFYWMTGLFYEPFQATIIVIIGGTGGAIAAYHFSRRMSSDFTAKITGSRFFKILQRHSDFLTLCALRSLPNFPHSVINYGSGIMNVPYSRFIISTAIGFGLKGFVYASAIRNAATADEWKDALSLEVAGPLFALAALLIIGKIIQAKANSRRNNKTRVV